MTAPFTPTTGDSLITADASRVTAAEFVAAFRPQPSKLELLCAELFDATDRARIREIHEEMAALRVGNAVERDLRFTIEMQRKAAA